MTTVRSQTESFIKTAWTRLTKNIIVDEEHFPPISHRFTAVYSRDKEYL